MNTNNLYSNITLNPKSAISFSDSFTIEHSDTYFRNNKKCLTQFSSPLVSYHNISNKYLFRKFSENNKNMIDLENSNNFIRKDLLFEQKNNISNSENEYNEENESEDNFEPSNNIFNENKIINNNLDIDEYKHLKSNRNYYQTYQESLNKENTIKNIISYSPTNIININYNNNNKELILNQTPNQIMNLNIINQFNLVNNNNFQRPRFKSSNIIEGNFIFPIFSNNNNINNINKKEINTEMFGRKGWICSFCNNFNFESRNKCNKCKQNKTPIKNKKKNNNNDNNFHKNNNNENKTQKQFSEREGDWICFNCKNVNFAFRKLCNRCQLSKIESESLFKINFQMFNSNIVGNNN